MKCPLCEAWSEVLETRDTRRRRQCANGHRFTTQEIVLELQKTGPFRRGKVFPYNDPLALREKND